MYVLYIFIYVIYIYIFFHYSLLHEIEQFPVPYGRTLLFIYYVYSGVHLLISNSSFIRPLPSTPLATISWFSMSVSLFLFCKEVHLCHISHTTRK